MSRAHPFHILADVHCVFQLLQVQCRWYWPLQNDPCHARIYIKSMDSCQDFSLRDVARIMPMLIFNPNLITGTTLVSDVERNCWAIPISIEISRGCQPVSFSQITRVRTSSRTTF